jgi:orotate phosphoribosyltransferase
MTTLRREADIAARAEIARRTEALFRESGALKEGHFLLKSGRHGDRYLEKFLVLQHPRITSELCGLWAARFRDADGRPLVDVVAGPTTGGVVLAFETARQLGVRSIFAEEVRDADGTSRREFRRGFSIAEGERVLLVDDILTTGGSLLAMLPPVEQTGPEIVGCAILVDRSGGTAALTSPLTGAVHPLFSLWILDLPTYVPGAATCPMCAAGIPLYAPGSTGTAAGGGPA